MRLFDTSSDFEEVGERTSTEGRPGPTGTEAFRDRMEHMVSMRGNAGVWLEPRHIKSRDRVRDLGEVYTQPREVEAMLDLVADAFEDIDTRFLEPAAGDGNFLVAILERKIAAIDEEKYGGSEHWYEFALLRCLASIYGIDISEENVQESRERITYAVSAAHDLRGEPATTGFAGAVTAILSTNIVAGDSLNAADRIILVEYSPQPDERFRRAPSELEPPEMDLFYQPPAVLPTIHYSELGA